MIMNTSWPIASSFDYQGTISVPNIVAGIFPDPLLHTSKAARTPGYVRFKDPIFGPERTVIWEEKRKETYFKKPGGLNIKGAFVRHDD